MNRRRFLLTLVGAELLTLVLVGWLWLSARAEKTAFEVGAHRLRDYCRFVAASLEIDYVDLQDPGKRAAASMRFFEGASGHSYREIVMCSIHPPDLSSHDACVLSGDFTCLAKMANSARLAVQANLDD